jgi:tRNA(fMet)-specific endonuclease VapC
MEELLMVLLDTNIIIELFKANQQILDEIVKIGIKNTCISKITVLELYIGVLNKREQQKVKNFLSNFSQINIDNQIIDRTIELIFQYRLSHGLFINDAILAATCLEHKIPIYTLNIKDFRFIPELVLL